MTDIPTRLLRVQTAPRTDQLLGDGTELTQLPYPLFAYASGAVARQDFWRGRPKRIVGFAADLAKQQVDLWWSAAYADPAQAVGMYIVVQDADGSMGTWDTAVETIEWEN